jgi:hypothetical protein
VAWNRVGSEDAGNIAHALGAVVRAGVWRTMAKRTTYVRTRDVRYKLVVSGTGEAWKTVQIEEDVPRRVIDSVPIRIPLIVFIGMTSFRLAVEGMPW